MTLITQSVITEEDIALNHLVKYIQFIPFKIPAHLPSLVRPNHLLVRYKKHLSSIGEEAFYQEDTEEKGAEKMKEDFKTIEEELNRNEIVVYSPRDCVIVEDELEEFSTKKIRRLFTRELVRLHDKHYNKLNFWT
tara:strand:- start:93 stop:497 length:405 start_codon:yes stop_codon:yes gene_type:complete